MDSVYKREPMIEAKRCIKCPLALNNRQFAPVETEYDWLSRDRERVQKFLKDPYCDFIFTAGAYRDMFQTILEDQRAEKRGHFVKNIPYLIISGSDDPVGECGKGIKRLVNDMKKLAWMTLPVIYTRKLAMKC